jgi:hypothetical protein
MRGERYILLSFDPDVPVLKYFESPYFGVVEVRSSQHHFFRNMESKNLIFNLINRLGESSFFLAAWQPFRKV